MTTSIHCSIDRARSIRSSILVAVAMSAALITSIGSRASAQTPMPGAERPKGKPIAIVGGTIFPVGDAPIARGVLLFRDGTIDAVGANVTIPPDAETIEVTGLSIYPGFVSAHTTLGLTEVGSVRQSNDYEEVGPLNPSSRAAIALNPESEIIPVARANGVTTALAVPRGGRLSGLSVLFHLDGWTFEDMSVLSPAALHLQWPTMAINRAPDVKPPVEEQLATRAASLREIDQLFADARAYWTARNAAGASDAKHADFDPRWEGMGPVLEGKIPVEIHASDYRQIDAALDWSRKNDVRIVIAGGYDAPELADRLIEQQVPVITQGILAQPIRDYEPYDFAYTLPMRLHDAGITYCISTGGDAANERNLPYHAAMAWSYGLPHDEALKSITLYPAQILGVGDRLGSLESGKEATFCVWDGDPLDVRSHVVREFIAGREVDLSSRHTRLRDKYRNRHVDR